MARKFTSGVIFAGPTTGKTTLAKAFADRGVVVLDTDDMTRFICPLWFNRKLWDVAEGQDDYDLKAELRALKDPVLSWLCAIMLKSAPRGSLAIFSNVPDPRGFFIGPNPVFAEGRKMAYYYRSDPSLIVDLTSQRGDPVSLERATKWSTTADRMVKKYPGSWMPIDLPAGVFLGDVLNWGHWKPTPEETAAAKAVAAFYLQDPGPAVVPQHRIVTPPALALALDSPALPLVEDTLLADLTPGQIKRMDRDTEFTHTEGA